MAHLFTNFKALFPAASMDIRSLVLFKICKKSWKGLCGKQHCLKMQRTTAQRNVVPCLVLEQCICGSAV